MLPTSDNNSVQAKLQAELDRLKRSDMEQREQISRLKISLAEREAYAKHCEQRLDLILHSNSWRLTAPLRAPRTQLARVRRLLGALAHGVRLSGGPAATIRKIYKVYRRDGLAGLLAKVSWLRSGAHRGIDQKSYGLWVKQYDTIDETTRAAIRQRIAGFKDAPRISVVMPTYNPKPEWIKEAIESVRTQLYPNWELCIADDASSDSAIRPLLETYAREDARIKVVFREQNGHISAASNSALEIATGEWIALLDHDDVLPEHALYCVVDAIIKKPSIRFLYSDEDKIDADGHRHDPHFKCDWNLDLFYSQNMCSHLGVYHKSLIDKVGGFRIGIEGSQDYDLLLRCIEHIDVNAIHHIPRVLYHWRVHATSTAAGSEAKPYTAIAGERALNEHFARLQLACKAEWVGYGYRVHYALPNPMPLISLIIPTRNGLHLIRQCIQSIVEKTIYPNYEIIVVDNGSDDPATLKYFVSLTQKQDGRVRVVRDARPFNYSALNNAAVAQAKGDLVGLINNDIEVINPAWLSEMVSLAIQPGVGAVGAKLLYPNDTLQHGGVLLGIGGVAGHANKYVPQPCHGQFSRTRLIGSYSAVTAACLVIRKSIYLEVGGLNEKDLTIAFNDVDFCIRVREAGYRNVWTPYAELYHHESATRGVEDNPEKQARFASEVNYMLQRWGDLLTMDPAYNPNLTLEHENFGLAWPPRVAPLV